MKYDKYLPIGTVVLLKEGSKRVMIIGFCGSSSDNNKQVYDYYGCLYPEGVVNNNFCLFNHNQIDKIYYLGLRDEEENSFKKELNEIVKKIEKA